MIIYLVGPQYSESGKRYLTGLSKTLENEGHTVFCPITLITRTNIEVFGAKASTAIFNRHWEALGRCGAVVALLDGPRDDGGVAWVAGYAYGKGIPVYGLRESGRQAGETRYSMVRESLSALVESSRDLLELLREAEDARVILAEAGKRG